MELRPCPFCGGKVVLCDSHPDEKDQHIDCDDCSMCFNYNDTIDKTFEDFINRWTLRKPEECKDCGNELIPVCAGLEKTVRGDEALMCRYADYHEVESPADYKDKNHLYTAGEDFEWIFEGIHRLESGGHFIGHPFHVTGALHNIRVALGIKDGRYHKMLNDKKAERENKCGKD